MYLRRWVFTRAFSLSQFLTPLDQHTHAVPPKKFVFMLCNAWFTVKKNARTETRQIVEIHWHIHILGGICEGKKLCTQPVSCIFLILKYSQFRSAPLCIVRRSMLDTQSKTQLAVALDIIPFNNCHTLHCEKHVGCCILNICQFSNAFSISNVQSIKNPKQPH